jgi:SAM-dependent methyltransferase
MCAATSDSKPDFSNRRLWQPIERCTVCDGGNVAETRMAADPHYGNPGLFRIYQCEDCGLQFLNPQPTQAYLDGAYPSTYYSFAPGSSPRRSAGAKCKRLLRYLLFRLFKRSDPEFELPGEMLDIGCGTGDFLCEMRELGWRVRGVEASGVAAEAGRLHSGLDIVAGFLPNARFPGAAFDYVRMNHSFEHMINPQEILREILRIIKPSGTLFIGVPNVNSLPARVFGSCWYNLGPPVHPYGYSPRSLMRLLAQEGFETRELRYHSQASGLTGSVQIWLNRGSGLPAHEGWVVKSRLLGFIGRIFMLVLDFIKLGDCIEVIARPAPGAPKT